MALRRILDLAGEQHGVLSAAQAHDLGMRPSSFGDLVRRQGWVRMHKGVYLAPAVARGVVQDAQAALLAGGDHAVLCRRTAAHFFGLVSAPEIVELFLPETERTTGLHGVRVYRTRTLLATDLCTVDGLRVTTPTRTLIDLAAVMEPPALRAVLIDARQRRLIDLDRLDRRIATMGRVRGIGAIRRLVWELHPEQSDSILEERVRMLLRRASLPPPDPTPVKVKTPQRTLRVDIGWPARRIGVEVDGFAYHSSRSALDRDQRRGNALALAGWRILRVGWDRVESDPDGFIAELRALLR